MADLTVVTPAMSGVNPAPVSCSAGGDAVPNPRGRAVVRVANGSGGSINVTFAAVLTNRPADGQFPAMTLGNGVIAIPAGAARLIGPIPTAFNDGNGKVQITYSAVTSMTIEATESPN